MLFMLFYFIFLSLGNPTFLFFLCFFYFFLFLWSRKPYLFMLFMLFLLFLISWGGKLYLFMLFMLFLLFLISWVKETLPFYAMILPRLDKPILLSFKTKQLYIMEYKSKFSLRFRFSWNYINNLYEVWVLRLAFAV